MLLCRLRLRSFDILPLCQIPMVSSSRARALFNAGLCTPKVRGGPWPVVLADS